MFRLYLKYNYFKLSMYWYITIFSVCVSSIFVSPNWQGNYPQQGYIDIIKLYHHKTPQSEYRKFLRLTRNYKTPMKLQRR